MTMLWRVRTRAARGGEGGLASARVCVCRDIGARGADRQITATFEVDNAPLEHNSNKAVDEPASRPELHHACRCKRRQRGFGLASLFAIEKADPHPAMKPKLDVVHDLGFKSKLKQRRFPVS